MLTCALADGLDGAVARLRARDTPWGTLVDTAADRLTEVAFAAALVALGAPAWAAALAVATSWTVEHVRDRAVITSRGAAPVVLTAAERPTRVVLTATTTLAAGLYPSAAAHWATAGALAGAVVGGIGVLHVLTRYRGARTSASGRTPPGG